MKTMFNLDIARALKAGDGANSNPCIPVPKEKNIWSASLFGGGSSRPIGTLPPYVDQERTGNGKFNGDSFIDIPFSRNGGGLSGTALAQSPIFAPYDGTIYRVDIPYRYDFKKPSMSHSNPKPSTKMDGFKKVKREIYGVTGLKEEVELHIPELDNWKTWNQWYDFSDLSGKPFYIPHIILVSDEAKYGKNNDNYLVTVLSGSRKEYFYPKKKKVKKGELIMAPGNMPYSVASMIDNYLLFMGSAGYAMTREEARYQWSYHDDKSNPIYSTYKIDKIDKDVRVMTEDNMSKYMKLSNIYEPRMFSTASKGVFNELSLMQPIEKHSDSTHDIAGFKGFEPVDAFGTKINTGQVPKKGYRYTPAPASAWLTMESNVQNLYLDVRGISHDSGESFIPKSPTNKNGETLESNLSPVGFLSDTRFPFEVIPTTGNYTYPGPKNYSVDSLIQSSGIENIGIPNSEIFKDDWLPSHNEKAGPECSGAQLRPSDIVLIGAMEFKNKIESAQDFLKYQKTNMIMGGNNVESYPDYYVRIPGELKELNNNWIDNEPSYWYPTQEYTYKKINGQMDYGTSLRFLFHSDTKQQVDNVPKTTTKSGGTDYFSGYQSIDDFSDNRMGYIFNYLAVDTFAYLSGMISSGELVLGEGEDAVHRIFEAGGRVNNYNIYLNHELPNASSDPHYILTKNNSGGQSSGIQSLSMDKGVGRIYQEFFVLYDFTRPVGGLNTLLCVTMKSSYGKRAGYPSDYNRDDIIYMSHVKKYYQEIGKGFYLGPFPNVSQTYAKERIHLTMARYNGKEKPRKELIEVDETFSDPMGWLLPMSL